MRCDNFGQWERGGASRREGRRDRPEEAREGGGVPLETALGERCSSGGTKGAGGGKRVRSPERRQEIERE